jgi:hypothetical protein
MICCCTTGCCVLNVKPIVKRQEAQPGIAADRFAREIVAF